MNVTYADGVFEDLVGHSLYLAERDEDASQRFLDACDETFRFLADNRFIGNPRAFITDDLSAVRMWRVKKFEKYLVFYLPVDDGVKILHVLHSSVDYRRVFEDE